MKKAQERVIWIFLLVICVVLGWSFASFGDFYVIPTIKRMFAPVAKTGQTICYNAVGAEISCVGAGQDGSHQKGVTWPEPRFRDNGDMTVTDNLTGLVWTKSGHCYSVALHWANAVAYCNAVADGVCGLSDGSEAGDWRLPNFFELESLLDLGNLAPSLPTGHPFTEIQSGYYWSSTSWAQFHDYAWSLAYYNGYVIPADKDGLDYEVWCVRGGQ